MRGFLKVCYFLYFEQNAACGEYRHAPDSSEKQHNVFVRKADVLQVIKLENFKQLRKWCSKYNFHNRDECCAYIALSLIYFGKEIVCTCGAADAWSKLKKNMRSMYRQEEDAISCSCFAQDTFPMYIVRCKNKIETTFTDIDDKYNECLVKPKVANYIVDASEREHMERFLAGTDDPLYDYVHLLQYGPDGGSEVNKAREEFESAAKKQKTLTNASTNA